MLGCTTKVAEYTSNNGRYFLIDTVGLTDTRFELTDKIEQIVKIIKDCEDGLNGIIVCFKHGKTDKETRITLEAVLSIFDEKIKTCSLTIVTFDDNGSGENWLKKQVLKDEDAKFILNCTNNRVISGSFISNGSDNEMDKIFQKKYRDKFLKAITTELDLFDKPIYLNFDTGNTDSFLQAIASFIQLLGYSDYAKKLLKLGWEFFFSSLPELTKKLFKIN